MALHIISIMDIQIIHTNNIAIMLIIERFFSQTFYRILPLSIERNFPSHHFHERHYKDEQYDATSIPFFSFLFINQTSDKTRN